MEEGEEVDVALLREVNEESGLTTLRLVRQLATEEQDGKLYHVLHLEVPAATLDKWEHVVMGAGEDKGMVPCYIWADLASRPELADIQSRWLPLIDT